MVMSSGDHVDDRPYGCSARRLGRGWILFGKKKDYFPYQCSVGPNWPGPFVLQGIMVLGTVLHIWAMPISNFAHVLRIISLLMVMFFISLTAFSDPGVIYRHEYHIFEGLEDPQKALVECTLCNLVRPSSAKHCYLCGVCIDKLDHHCPWMGKCIGRKTIRAFRSFLVALSCHLGLLFVLTMYCASKDPSVAELAAGGLARAPPPIGFVLREIHVWHGALGH